MKPTFNLSAAEAALTLPASKSPAASARSDFLIINLQIVGESHDPQRARPIEPVAEVKN
jgi:hypothetical protein